MMPASAPAAKTERLLNLVLVLLYTRRPLTRAQIREAVPQYGQAASDEAFQRMFERDKDELRGLGIPLVTQQVSSYWDDEEGYRIHQRDYALPDIEFEPDELAVLGLASRAWTAASLTAPAASALRKLRASGVERDDEAPIGIEPRLRAVEPAFDPVRDAVTRQRPIGFAYRRPGGAEAIQRRIQPWAMLSWHGAWYVSGFDLDREAARLFRLSRIEGEVRGVGTPGSYEIPEDHDIRAMVGVHQGEAPNERGEVRIRVGRGHALRRRAVALEHLDEEWDRCLVDHVDIDDFASELAAHGADVVAQEPAELVERTHECLAGVLAAHRQGR